MASRAGECWTDRSQIPARHPLFENRWAAPLCPCNPPARSCPILGGKGTLILPPRVGTARLPFNSSGLPDPGWRGVYGWKRRRFPRAANTIPTPTMASTTPDTMTMASAGPVTGSVGTADGDGVVGVVVVAAHVGVVFVIAAAHAAGASVGGDVGETDGDGATDADADGAHDGAVTGRALAGPATNTTPAKAIATHVNVLAMDRTWANPFTRDRTYGSRYRPSVASADRPQVWCAGI